MHGNTPQGPTTARPRWDVIGLGAVAVDDLICVERYPDADAKVQVCDTARQCGGLTATALVAAARLGARCAYAGVIGTDECSGFAAERLAAEGVDLSHCDRRAEARVFHSRIVVGAAGATRNIFSDGRGVVGADPGVPAESVLREARVVFVDHVGIPGMLRAARVARTAGIPVVGDVERNSGPGFQELCDLVDHFIVSHEFAGELTGETEPQRAVLRLARNDRKAAVVTAGVRGCWFWSPEHHQVKHQPAFAVAAIDTTGCGDVFHGAYAAGLAFGLCLEERVRLAAAAAALKATVVGGQAGCPTRTAVEDFLHRSSSR